MKKRKRFVMSEEEVRGEMHPWNPYRHRRPDFQQLSEKYPHILKDFIISPPSSSALPSTSSSSSTSTASTATSSSLSSSRPCTMDWTSPEAQRALTAALLLEDFGVSNFQVPGDRLCPPLPNRINYVCWVQQLLSEDGIVGGNVQPRVLDIGTGASCIYPILGHKLFGWKCIGSDIDFSSISNAKQILSANNLDDVIETVLVEPSTELQKCIADQDATESSVQFTSLSQSGPLIQALDKASIIKHQKVTDDENNMSSDSRTQDGIYFDACMTNPPFYDVSDVVERNNHTSCTGSVGEMYTVGGEVAFVASIISDSLKLRNTVRWYSTMLGKKQSLKKLLRLLRQHGITNTASTRFIQGSATVRWGLAWSFCPPNEGVQSKSKVFASKNKASNGSIRSVIEVSSMSVDTLVATSTFTELAKCSNVFRKHNKLRESSDCQTEYKLGEVLHDLRHEQFDIQGISNYENKTFMDILRNKMQCPSKSFAVFILCICRICSAFKNVNTEESSFSAQIDDATFKDINCITVHASLHDKQCYKSVTLVVSSNNLELNMAIHLADNLTSRERYSLSLSCEVINYLYRSLCAKLGDSFQAEWKRSNRRWRRILQKS